MLHVKTLQELSEAYAWIRKQLNPLILTINSFLFANLKIKGQNKIFATVSCNEKNYEGKKSKLICGEKWEENMR